MHLVSVSVRGIGLIRLWIGIIGELGWQSPALPEIELGTTVGETMKMPLCYNGRLLLYKKCI